MRASFRGSGCGSGDTRTKDIGSGNFFVCKGIKMAKHTPGYFLSNTKRAEVGIKKRGLVATPFTDPAPFRSGRGDKAKAGISAEGIIVF